MWPTKGELLMREGDEGGAGAGADAGAGDAGGAAQGGAAEGRTFTQADLDRIVQDRLLRERQKFADYEDLKSKAAKFDELESAQKSELEKANERLAALERQAADAAQAAQDALLRAAVVSEAARRNVIDPDAAFALIDRAALEFAEDGQPLNVAEAMDSLLEARPYLVAQQGGSRGNADQGARGGRSGQLSRDDLKNMSPAEIVKAQAEGRLQHLLAGES